MDAGQMNRFRPSVVILRFVAMTGCSSIQGSSGVSVQYVHSDGTYSECSDPDATIIAKSRSNDSKAMKAYGLFMRAIQLPVHAAYIPTKLLVDPAIDVLTYAHLGGSPHEGSHSRLAEIDQNVQPKVAIEVQ